MHAPLVAPLTGDWCRNATSGHARSHSNFHNPSKQTLSKANSQSVSPLSYPAGSWEGGSLQRSATVGTHCRICVSDTIPEPVPVPAEFAAEHTNDAAALPSAPRPRHVSNSAFHKTVVSVPKMRAVGTVIPDARTPPVNQTLANIARVTQILISRNPPLLHSANNKLIPKSRVCTVLDDISLCNSLVRASGTGASCLMMMVHEVLGVLLC